MMEMVRGSVGGGRGYVGGDMTRLHLMRTGYGRWYRILGRGRKKFVVSFIGPYKTIQLNEMEVLNTSYSVVLYIAYI